MKTALSLLILLALLLPAHAQEEMPEVWSTKFDHLIDFYGCDNIGSVGYGYAASQKELSVYDNKTGKVVWTKSFKELAPGLRKIDDIIGIWEAKKLFLLDLKMGSEKVAVVDMLTGELLWESDRYKLRMREMITYIPEEEAFLFTFKEQNVLVHALTGEERWSTAKFRGTVGKYLYADGMLTAVNFIPEGLFALFSGFKNQIAKIDMRSGEVLWENTYRGRAQRKIVTKEWLYDLSLDGDQVVLSLNGLQVYDHKTGAQLWSASVDYDIPISKPGNAISYGVYGAVPPPIFTDKHLYLVDISGKNKQFVNKYDRQTGKLIWQSQEIKDGARVVPNLYVVNDKVILQIGGLVEVQGYFTERQTGTDGTTYTVTVAKVFDQSIKPYGVQTFNDADGRLVWDSERFKKGITNVYVHDGDKLIVSSGKALYSLAVADGSVHYEVDAKNGGVGDVVQLLQHKDKIVVIGEKGVSTFGADEGKLIAASKYKRASVRDYSGDFVLLETATNDFATFNVADKCKFWKYNARKGSSSELTTDGQHIYLYEKKTVTKLKTRGA